MPSPFLPSRGRSLPQRPAGKGPLAELRTFLGSWCKDLRNRRDYRNLVDGEAALDIASDIQARDGAVAAAAFTAEQADLEAFALLEKAKAGGLDNSDLPLIEQALRNITRSADADHQITEGMKA